MWEGFRCNQTHNELSGNNKHCRSPKGFIHNFSVSDIIISDLERNADLWTTPDSIYTWAPPDSRYVIIDVNTTKAYFDQIGNGVGIVSLSQLRTKISDPELVFFKIIYYDASLLNEQIHPGTVLSKVYIKWDNSTKQKIRVNLNEVAKYRKDMEPTVSAVAACPDWSGSPRSLYAGYYYDLKNFGGAVFTPWVWWFSWDLGSTYVFINDFSLYNFANITSSCFGDFDLKTETCGNVVYRRFVYTKQMWLYKGVSGTGGYSVLVWELNTTRQPFTIRVAYPYFPYQWHKDFSMSSNNINNNVESAAILMETIQKIY